MTKPSLKIKIYTDGSCLKNPGPGGWCCILIHPKQARLLCGSIINTTNNRMELLSVIEGLKQFKKSSNLEIFTDSQYVRKAFTEDWITSWKTKGLLTKENSRIKNVDLWSSLIPLTEEHTITWTWVKGHSGVEMNEWCDVFANKMAHTQKPFLSFDFNPSEASSALPSLLAQL